MKRRGFLGLIMGLPAVVAARRLPAPASPMIQDPRGAVLCGTCFWEQMIEIEPGPPVRFFCIDEHRVDCPHRNGTKRYL